MEPSQKAGAVRFAHSAPGRSPEVWETVGTHSAAVAALASRFGEAFGFAAAARAAGLLHDIGKCSPEFQAYIRASDDAVRGPNHAYAGAFVARERVPEPLGRILAAIIAGHHAGLANGTDLDDRLASGPTIVPSFDGWEAEVGTLPGRSVVD